jgi:peptide/nickel transport system substrate-binding protein
MSAVQLVRVVGRACRVTGVAGALALLAAGCGSGSSTRSAAGQVKAGASFLTPWPTGGTPVRGGAVTIDGPEALTTFIPSSDGTDTPAISQVFDQLTELMPGKVAGSQPVLTPALATSWTVSPDHLTYTFQIRQGVRFSNGEPLTGEDVVFSLKQASGPLSLAAPFTTAWKSVSLAGPMTVKLALKEPQPPLPETLDDYAFGIVSKKAFEREGAKSFALHPVGTGPFTLKSATAGFTTLSLVRNPNYWRTGLPYLNELVFNQVESDNARILAVRSGQATIAQQIPYAEAASLKSTPGVKMLVGPVWGASYNWFNRGKAPFNEAAVRRALLYATPREEIIKAVYKGLGTPSNGLWGEEKYWDPKVPLIPFDLAKAKEELKTSSVPNGFNMTLNVSAGESQGALLASILQSAWSQIGVHVAIQSVSSATLFANFFAGKYQFDVFPPEEGFNVYFNPDGIRLYFDNKEPGWGPPATASFVTKLITATSSPSEAARQKLFGELQYQGYWKEALFQPIVNLVSLNLVSPGLRGFQELPSTSLRVERAWVQK